MTGKLKNARLRLGTLLCAVLCTVLAKGAGHRSDGLAGRKADSGQRVRGFRSSGRCLCHGSRDTNIREGGLYWTEFELRTDALGVPRPMSIRKGRLVR